MKYYIVNLDALLIIVNLDALLIIVNLDTLISKKLATFDILSIRYLQLFVY